MLAAVVILTAVIGMAGLVAGCGGGKDEAAPATTETPTGGTTVERPPRTTAGATLATSAARVRQQLKGIPQHGLVLGSPTAPVTIVEYGTFACPTCAALHRDVLPEVIERYVRTGKASLEFRGIAGDDASQARDLALASWAASAQRHGWDFLQLAYRRSLEGTLPGAVPESTAQLADALGLDAKRLGTDTERPKWVTQVRAAASVAGVARMSAFPVFLVRARTKPDQPFVVLTQPASVRAFRDAVAKAGRAGG
jgi:protein-disulfide isomerase